MIEKFFFFQPANCNRSEARFFIFLRLFSKTAKLCRTLFTDMMLVMAILNRLKKQNSG